MSFALLADPISKDHDTGPGHPERPERFDAVMAALDEDDLLDGAIRLDARAATLDELALCHDPAYVHQAEWDVVRGRGQLSTGDTEIGPASFQVALHAAGGVMNAVDAVLGGAARNAFCVVRPPGHHARPKQGMGFCLFNNIALGARHAQRKFGVERVLIVDWDVHHGNGTQDIFYDDGSVFFFSTHQSPWYPGTGAAGEAGEGAGRGATMNRPFPAGAGRAEILAAFRQDLAPALREFRPELVMISAGFDSRRGDPLGRFLLDDQDFADLTDLMLEAADAAPAGGRLVSVLEGGYDLNGLASAVRAHVARLRAAVG